MFGRVVSKGKFALLALAIVVPMSMTNVALAQQYSNESQCENLVSGYCAYNWEEEGWSSYQECYSVNLYACGLQNGEPTGGYDHEGPAGFQPVPGPRACHGTGTVYC